MAGRACHICPPDMGLKLINNHTRWLLSLKSQDKRITAAPKGGHPGTWDGARRGEERLSTIQPLMYSDSQNLQQQPPPHKGATNKKGIQAASIMS